MQKRFEIIFQNIHRKISGDPKKFNDREACLPLTGGNSAIYFDPDLSNYFLSVHTISGCSEAVMECGMKPNIFSTYLSIFRDVQIACIDSERQHIGLLKT